MVEERHKRFTKKRIALCAAGVLFAAVIGLLVANHDSTPMPVYQGKTAREWLYVVSEENLVNSQNAYKQMGSNAFPFLVNESTRKNSSLENLQEWLYPKLPQGVRRHFSAPWPEGLRQDLALEYLVYANSGTASPSLLRPEPEGNETLRFTGRTTLITLVKPKDTNLVPQLTMCLNPNNPRVSLIVAATLDVLHSGERAIPTLTNIMVGTNESQSAEAWNLLRKIDPTNAAKWGVMFSNRPASNPSQITDAPK